MRFISSLPGSQWIATGLCPRDYKIGKELVVHTRVIAKRTVGRRGNPLHVMKMYE